MLSMPNGVGRGIRTSLPGWVREVSQTGSLRMWDREIIRLENKIYST